MTDDETIIKNILNKADDLCFSELRHGYSHGGSCGTCGEFLEDLIKEAIKLARADEREKIKNAIFPIYKGLISKADAWSKSGDVLCYFIEQEIKKALEAQE